MGYGKKIKDWFTEDVENEGMEEEYTEEVDTEPKTSIFEQAHSQRTSEAVKAFGANKEGQLILVEPRSFSEASEIANYLKRNRAAVVNLHRLQKEQSKRIIDFLSGVIYAIDGDIQQIAPKVFLCTPKSLVVAGNITMDEDEQDM